jgi:uncharacterized repeat protein (TIGR01451 family)
VGQIIEVGSDGTKTASRLNSRGDANVVEKLGIDFARGITATTEKAITRGSAKLTDDLLVKKGQTWVSLTSPTEGITRITALAPDAEVWDRRRQTATIYWVDARWQFPPPKTELGNAPTTLTTLVTRSEGFAPAEGWIVRYTSLDPNIAIFPRANGPIVDAVVDADGKATVEVSNVTGKSTTAVIGIEVMRPAQASENMPKLTLGTGQTMITWSAADLLLDARGPQMASVNEVIRYTASLSNLGNLPAQNARLTMAIPNGMRLAAAPNPPPGQQSNTAIAWDLPNLPARQRFDVAVDLQPTADSDYRIDFEAASTSGATHRQVVSTLVTSPQVRLQFAPAQGSQQVEVGALVGTDLIVSNAGRSSISNLEVFVETDPGLQSIHEEANRVKQIIPYLGPGESRPLDAKFIARQTGNLKATAIVLVNQVELARQSTNVVVVEATPREPRLSLQFKPNVRSIQTAVNQVNLVELSVINSGQTVLNNVQVAIGYSSSLEPSRASSNFNDLKAQRQLVWTIQTLEIGATVQYAAEFIADGSEATPRITGTASAPPARADAALDFQLVGGSGSVMPPASVNPPGSVLPPAPVLPPANESNNDILPGNGSGNVMPQDGASSGLSITLRPVRSQVPLNAEMQYVLSIRNNRPDPDQNVEVNLQLQSGLELREVTTNDGRRVQTNYTSDGSSAGFETIRFLGANETIVYNIRVAHRVTGEIAMRVNVRSALNPRDISATGTANVTAQ